MKGRRKPTAQHKADGTFQASRHARRVDAEGAGGPLGSPPAGMDDVAAELWQQVVELLPEDVLQKLDGATLGEMCGWYSDLQ
jgi:phage terminase small subunit